MDIGDEKRIGEPLNLIMGAKPSADKIGDIYTCVFLDRQITCLF